MSSNYLDTLTTQVSILWFDVLQREFALTHCSIYQFEQKLTLHGNDIDRPVDTLNPSPYGQSLKSHSNPKQSLQDTVTIKISLRVCFNQVIIISDAKDVCLENICP